MKTLQVFLSGKSFVRFAYLFGSVASGRERADSDVDVAVYFTSGTDNMRRFDYRLQLIDELTTTFKTSVDVVDLDSAPLPLRHFIMRDGILIMERDQAERVHFEVSSRREYFDIKHHLDRRADALLDRL